MGSKATDGKTQRQHLEADVNALRPDAATALYRTIDDAVKTLRDHYDPNAINAVVVLTDGVNEARGGPDIEGLTSTIGDPNKPPVRVFTIAYGHKADRAKLSRIAEATHAHAYDASDANSIPEVLTNVVSNF
jgi:Ca-activated chloride channel family protein